jgi:hypothetical protein
MIIEFSFSHVLTRAIVNESVVYEEMEKFICNALNIATEYCQCREGCLSIMATTASGDDDSEDVYSNSHRYFKNVATPLKNGESRNILLLQHPEFFELHVNLNVTVNAVDFVVTTGNVTHLLMKVQRSLANLHTSSAYSNLVRSFLMTRHDLFYPDITLTADPKVMTFDPHLWNNNDVPSFSPTPSRTVISELETTTEAVQAQSWSTVEIIGLSMSLVAVSFFQCGVLYLCCCRIRKVSARVGIDERSASEGSLLPPLPCLCIKRSSPIVHDIPDGNDLTLQSHRQNLPQHLGV